MHNNALEQRKTLLRLSPRQREIIIGTLLGDGHLETQNQGKTFRLKIEHAITQRPYVEWLSNAFGDWVNTPPRIWTRRVHQTIYRKYGFQTLSHPALRFFAHQWYDHGHKVVPKQIERWLTPLAVTVWYMDDGSVKSNQTNGRILNTQGFRPQDVQRLIRALNHRYGLTARRRRQREGYQIFLPAQDAPRLLALLNPRIIPMFRYKLPTEGTRMPKM